MPRREGLVLLIAAVLGTASLLGCSAEKSPPSATTAASAEKAPIFVNITAGKENVHAASMALRFAQSALDRGRRVTVFLNVDAPLFAAKDLGDDVRVADFPPVRQMVADILARGGSVLVCSHCAAVAKVDTAALLPGIKVVMSGDVIDMLEPGTVGISY